jgi:hypothetical protein
VESILARVFHFVGVLSGKQRQDLLLSIMGQRSLQPTTESF